MIEEQHYTVVREAGLIFFILNKYKDQVNLDNMRSWFSSNTIRQSASKMHLMQLSEYVIDTNTGSMVKNRYGDQEWPRQVFNELFSGVDQPS